MKGLWVCLVQLIVAVSAQEMTHSFLQQAPDPSSTEDNPFNRTSAKRPNYGDKKGTEADHGSLRYLLLTSYESNSSGSGKVWVIPSKRPKDSFVLIAGLERPRGVCYDRNHGFVYVCDGGMRAVLQVEVDGKGGLVLGSDQVAMVYEGREPTACAVDGYGNLFITEAGSNSIQYIAYRDLWSGYIDMNQTLYQGYTTLAGIGSPSGLQVLNSDTLYFTNSKNQDDFGLLNTAPAQLYNDISSLKVLLRSEHRPMSLALSPHYAYYTTQDGTIWGFKYHGKPGLYLKSVDFLRSPNGICYSDGNLYIADSSLGEVYTFPDNSKEKVTLKGVIRISGAQGLACVNS